ncbi:hypothetical protein PHYPSEUDO_010580 [Phytophthora pseudosyringae]|uniref:RxLR effector protein n=1 Tax=Phytophthora pseudosyringae TaxID=221518 RepID=A0A8T1VCX5_9STRA|nr:hypothetical protein PHYPSEUDO_010580 [Phytophthora pseudosyringae]
MLASAIALAFTSPIAARSATTALSSLRLGSHDAAATAEVQPGSEIGADEFVNEKAAATSPPEEDFENTALSATDENSIVGDVGIVGSYTGATTALSAATKAGESSEEDDSSGVSTASTTPVLFAAAAACVVAIGAIAIVKKRTDTRAPSPHTPVDKAIYYQVEVEATVKKPGHFHVNQQLTPPV